MKQKEVEVKEAIREEKRDLKKRSHKECVGKNEMGDSLITALFIGNKCAV